MKKLILFITMSLLVTKGYSQERVNTVLPKINLSVGTQLISAKGWMLNPEGQWICRQNRIPIYMENEYKSLIDYGVTGLGVDGFLSYQIREVIIQGKIYKILIKKYKNLRYKYPAIKEGQYTTVSFYFFVIDNNEFTDTLKKLKNNQINTFKFKCLFTGEVGDYLPTQCSNYKIDIEKNISKQILNPEDKNGYTEYLVMEIKPNKEKNYVRFIFSDYHEKFEDGYSLSFCLNNHIFCSDINDDMYYWEKLFGNFDGEVFNRCYFETDYLSFSTFIKINN